jgi:hypothetical protein
MKGQTMGSPVDNNTYNLLQTLTSKLEAIEAYDKYVADADGDARNFFEECKRSDERSVETLLSLLGDKLASRSIGVTSR